MYDKCIHFFVAELRPPDIYHCYNEGVEPVHDIMPTFAELFFENNARIKYRKDKT